MKPTSSLSLLLFLSLATASPIPSRFPKDCLHYTTCTPWLREVFSSSPSPLSSRINDHTPPTRLPPPHFPAHHPPSSSSPETHREIEAEFNNSPVTPPDDEKPSVALSGGRPLQSSYLLSLANPAQKNPPQAEPQETADALPSKPTSALPELREEDKARYWATITSDHPVPVKKEAQEELEAVISDDSVKKCGDYSRIPGSAYLRVGQPIVLARDYSDLLVVGIVVLFLVAVVLLEAVEYCGDLRSAIRAIRERPQRRGEIYLEDDEGVQWIAKKSFYLQPGPGPKFKSSLSPLREGEWDTEKGELYHD